MGNNNVINFTEAKSQVEAKRELDNNIKIYKDDIFHDLNVTISIGAIKEDKKDAWRAYLLKELQKYIDSKAMDISFLNLKYRLLHCLVLLVQPNVSLATVLNTLRYLCISEEEYQNVLGIVIEYSARGREVANYLENYGLYGNLVKENFARQILKSRSFWDFFF